MTGDSRCDVFGAVDFAAGDKKLSRSAREVIQEVDVLYFSSISTDLENWKTVSEGDIVDGVYSLPSATNGFARVIYSLTW